MWHNGSMSEYHQVADRICQLFANAEYSYQRFEHEPVCTSEEAYEARPGYTLEQGAKAIIVRVKPRGGGEKYFHMLALAGSDRFDTKAAKAALAASDMRFATNEEVAELTEGVQPGGIPPMGSLFSLETTADPHIFEHETVIFNAGDRRVSVAVAAAALKAIEQPQIAPIAAGSTDS
jgi:prolyl-tRNA editing enzyme YbaK/EbsC (Cys-tRNA(Pro) deacylase)